MSDSTTRRYDDPPLEPYCWSHGVPEDFNALALSYVALHHAMSDRFPWFSPSSDVLLDWHPDCPTDAVVRRLSCLFMAGALRALNYCCEAVSRGDNSEAGRVELFRAHIVASASLDTVEAMRKGETTDAVVAASIAAQLGVLVGLEPLAKASVEWKESQSDRASKGGKVKAGNLTAEAVEILEALWANGCRSWLDLIEAIPSAWHRKQDPTAPLRRFTDRLDLPSRREVLRARFDELSRGG